LPGCRRTALSPLGPCWTPPARNLNPRIKSLSVASSPEFMAVRAAAQPRAAYSAEPGRTAVNCNPNCNPDACGRTCSPSPLETAGGPPCRAGPLLSSSVRRRCCSALGDRPFSGGADAQLSPITLQGLAVRGCARLALAAHVAVTVAVSDHWAGVQAVHTNNDAGSLHYGAGTGPLTRVSYDLGSTTLVTTQRCLPILRSRMNPSFS
jgi:hypothetical protein